MEGRLISTCSDYTEKGLAAFEICSKGKVKFYPFRLSSDDKPLIWISSSGEKRLKLASVSKIVPRQELKSAGQMTIKHGDTSFADSQQTESNHNSTNSHDKKQMMIKELMWRRSHE
ncbi:hypothetical protein Bca52824_026581 [Brassica carinata]|uniref:Uncharacterized protein n=1 Tax=Brassica carinata TaxID=52824 RepID=A0A8X7SGS3_BRACI|nr:hypothetical protein Bca52824_026581 [Brassica carinata]